jgi:hypothetical protein
MLRQRYLERRLGRLVVLCGAAILLAGCFDVQLGIKLHNDGSGAVTTRIILSKEMTDMAAAGRSKPMPALLGKDNRNVRTTSEIRNGQLVTEETVGFAHLSDVPLSDDNIEVTNLGRTFFGAARSRIRWSLGSTHNDPNAGDMRAMAAFLVGHTFTLSMEIPCHVEKASNVSVNGISMAPSVQGDWMRGSTVQWQVPLTALFSGMNGGNVTFDAVCWSWLGIPSARTQNLSGSPDHPVRPRLQ